LFFEGVDFAVFEVYFAAGKEQATAKAKAIDKSLRLRLCSGLRQSGDRFAVVL
jgi:hypothetical protein